MNPTDLVYRNGNGVPVTTSVIVAEYFGKNHQHVMEAIRMLLVSVEKTVETENQEIKTCFELSSYETPLNNGTGAVKKTPMYIMNEDGFTLLAMGFTGDKARVFKIRYIKAFKAMRETIQQGGLQFLVPYLNAQTQLTQRVIDLCDTLMQRLGNNEADEKPKSEAVHSKVAPPAWKTVSSNTARYYFSDYLTVRETVKELGRRGIHIYLNTLYEYLRNNGYLSRNERTYNRPSACCIQNHWMIAVGSGTSKDKTKCRRYFTPYLSPEFVERLESELGGMRCSDPGGFQLELGFGKEVQG